MAWLLARAKPRFWPLAMRVAPGKSDRTISGEPSVDPLSTTSNSNWPPSPEDAQSDSRQRRKRSLVFQLTTMAESRVTITTSSELIDHPYRGMDPSKHPKFHRQICGTVRGRSAWLEGVEKQQSRPEVGWPGLQVGMLPTPVARRPGLASV